ncbi:MULTISPECIES: hypothetical protein [unclassified Bradyrhizobium]|uniref:hypothetical protein n=1 Tax=unclassified Bradyrhizobium TaxID=2631580 RepID=UPI001BAA5315|nr:MULTISPECIES: hypothetical protein [unclassified Bradyrhizobium]MBR1224282.1 hypothetical protein [Bradyrhizobium sp. AUGA SZCCT0176]MBR1230908.1 hypothetical protein [Bradyrhizobium sp. AUGA SZCCT0182]MBR1283072.1 hypothetical protein [Bradyrhizobium sp. AUGA SZCCT0177]MBR1297785.1 hypothetical protein [Bradyrhizobium sp. AUGA SZCCT0042]
MPLVLAPAELIDQLLQSGREFGFRTHILLQAFADGIADRLRSPVIDLLENGIDSAIHGEFQRRF